MARLDDPNCTLCNSTPRPPTNLLTKADAVIAWSSELCPLICGLHLEATFLHHPPPATNLWAPTSKNTPQKYLSLWGTCLHYLSYNHQSLVASSKKHIFAPPNLHRAPTPGWGPSQILPKMCPLPQIFCVLISLLVLVKAFIFALYCSPNYNCAEPSAKFQQLKTIFQFQPSAPHELWKAGWHDL